jgi:hypothetical protein
VHRLDEGAGLKRLALLAILLVASCSAKERLSTLPDEAASTIRFERHENLIFVPVRLNGSDALWFILDSGSSRMLVDEGVAKRLEFPVGAASTVQGAGLGRIPVQRIAAPVDIVVGEVRSAGHQFDSIDLAGVSRVVGRRIDGILGYELFSRFVVTVDYAARTLELEEPSGWRGLPGATEVELTIRERWPLVRGTLHIPGVGEVSDEFLVDLGSGDAVSHPAIKKTSGYLRQTMTGVGLGFPTTGHIGTATRFEIGPYSIHDITVACCGATQATSRLIGGGVLSRFICAFDYSRQRLHLKPNRLL